MFRKLMLASGIACMLATGVYSAEVVIKVAPPRAIVEKRGPRPGPRHVWVAGYHRWDGNRYVWTPGSWMEPPRPHAVWVPAHYAHRRGGYVFIEGHWR